MSLIESTNYVSTIQSDAVSADQKVLNDVAESSSGKEKLKKVAKEFESIFISKMFTTMDATVDKEGGIFGDETKYFDTMKSFMYNEMGRQLANNPRTTFGFAKQVYEQMERYVKD